MRYQAAKDPDTASSCDLIPSKLASAVWDHLKSYKSSIPNFPQKETCELLILHRSVDQVIGDSFPDFLSSMLLSLIAYHH